MSSEGNMNGNEETISKKREGKTLLISNEEKIDINYEGIEDVHTTNNGSRFIVFNSLENAKFAYESLIEKNVKVKYSYYKLFFRLKNIDFANTDYNTLKTKIHNILKEKNIEVLYFKFYTKNKMLLGSGDLTTDTKVSFDALINLNEIKFDESSNITFYRFKIKSNDKFKQTAHQEVS